MAGHGMNDTPALQDLLTGNTCFGCGADNAQGLQIKSRWSEETDGELVCTFQAQPHHNAGSAGVLNGGIIATIMDCHSIVTAIAQAYRDAGRDFGAGEKIWYVTGSFELRYRKPALLRQPVVLTSRVTEVAGNKSVVTCELSCSGDVCTTSRMTAVRVPMEWHDRHAHEG